MSELEALLLGVVQGLTEFLPISSSGHLILVPWLQDYTYLREHDSFNKTFDVALHAGTLVAVVSYFHVELRAAAVGFVRSVRKRSIKDPSERLAWVLVIGTIPAVVVGGLGEDWIDENLGEPWMIGILLIVFGLVLGIADRLPQHRALAGVRLRDGLYIGLAQILSLAPGVSRSGITITTGRMLQLDRDTAARVSFLLLFPVTFGAVAFKGYEAIREGLPDGVLGPIAVGVIASAISGYVAIAGLLALVRRHNYDPFVIFRVLVGVGVLILIATGVRSATF
ncbi:MAG TPA: undecaprenyl-diphosphate phosphatase [Solirubrobacterales bacterium]|jgi:undecaprenyl-diphosphatase|nr:undecaprenyl-diphosphate phosphatase [Solirubrobacterales bacterium]